MQTDKVCQIGNGISSIAGKHYARRAVQKYWITEKVVGLISYKKSTPVGLSPYRSKIKIGSDVGMKEVPCKWLLRYRLRNHERGFNYLPTSTR
jgi:hypothetical protein